ncbi:hypothetical protein BX600DRAFT_82959 [Xylariales sp. PMI_506]|nr:hypothetical protein BX600DRAFT_82959 [Xylariales sp. PMI_506]
MTRMAVTCLTYLSILHESFSVTLLTKNPLSNLTELVSSWGPLGAHANPTSRLHPRLIHRLCAQLLLTAKRANFSTLCLLPYFNFFLLRGISVYELQ